MFLNYLIYIFVVILCKIQPKITAYKIIQFLNLNFYLKSLT